MPRFHFNVDGAAGTDVELPSIASAKCEAVRYVGQLICDSADTFWDAHEFQMTVIDESGMALFSLHLIGTEAPVIQGQLIS